MSTRSWMKRVGAVAAAVGCVLASLGGGSAATAAVAAVPSTPWAWGYNHDGELGNGTAPVPSYTPVQVSGLSGVTAIAAGLAYSLAVKSDGTAWAWGNNSAGVPSYTPVQVSGLSGVTAIAAGTHSLALKSDGTAWAWGAGNAGGVVQVSGLSGVTAIAAGTHSLALKSDGTAWAWGYNGFGQLGDGTTTDRLTPVQVSGLSGVTAIAAGLAYSLAVKSDGTAWAWGNNWDGELGDGTTMNERSTPVQVSGLSGVTAISGSGGSGGSHSLAVKSDGTAWAWGFNTQGELGDGTTNERSTPVQVSGLSGVTAIAAGWYHSLAVKSDGTAWAWGENAYGDLGDGTTNNSSTPVQVSGLSGVTAIAGGGFHSLALSSPPSCPAAGATPATERASSTNQYTLSNNDGAAWQEIDAAKLRVICTPTANQSVLLTANADLFTGSAGYNQDIGIFVSDNGGADQLLAWKESGGFAGTFSPNAAYVQHLFNMSSGHAYVFKLKWKTNKPASGATIYAGAGNGPYSPTSLVAEAFPTGVVPNFARSTTQYTLPNSDGTTWQNIDLAHLSTTLSPSANATAVLGANADLFTGKAGYNQDIGIFVSDNGGADSLVAWKESGGFAGTFSPNAAFVKATYPMTGGHSYAFKLKWKTNKNAAGATIYAGAGNGPYSPTSLVAQSIAAGANPYTAVSTSQYSLSNSDGTTWQPIAAALNVTVTPGTSTNSILGANADLFTGKVGYNQDLGIFVSDNGGTDVLLAWKESGGFAGTFSPNAAFAQYTYQMTSGHTYVFKLKWKTNKNAPGATIYAAAGGPAPFSPTRLTVELTN
jgi:alpha-tubulin suppressor-like RCC1 family protein